MNPGFQIAFSAAGVDVVPCGKVVPTKATDLNPSGPQKLNMKLISLKNRHGLPQQSTILLQPFLRDLVIGTSRRDLLPVALGMIGFTAMYEFMENNVVLDMRLARPASHWYRSS